MSTTRGSKRGKTQDEVEKDKSQQDAGSSSFSGRKKPDKRFGKRKLTAEQLAKWRKSTARKMKRSAKGTLKQELPEVLVSVLEEAHDGSCQHAKFLMEISGPEVLYDKKQAEKNRSLVEMLLEKIG
jgi:hypothetical protein